MEVIDVSQSESTLRIRLAGHHGHGEENLIAGRLVKSVLEDAMDNHRGEFTEVVIDYSEVYGVGGDGPIWSVMPAIQRKIDVRFVACGETYDGLAELLAATRMDQFIRLESR